MKHSCGILRESETNQAYVVVAGGFDGTNSLDSIETWYFSDSIYEEWVLENDKLPMPFHGAGNMIPEKGCHKAYFIAGKSTQEPKLQSIIAYDWSNQNSTISASNSNKSRADFTLINMNKGQDYCY